MLNIILSPTLSFYNTNTWNISKTILKINFVNNWNRKIPFHKTLAIWCASKIPSTNIILINGTNYHPLISPLFPLFFLSLLFFFTSIAQLPFSKLLFIFTKYTWFGFWFCLLWHTNFHSIITCIYVTCEDNSLIM